MPLPRIVFHCADRELFDSFIQQVPRQELIVPLRADRALRLRLFRGYKISQNRPSIPSLAQAYYREINDRRNDGLLNHLCTSWLTNHGTLAATALASIGLRDVNVGDPPSWLHQAHDTLTHRGHVETGKAIVRALAFDFRLEDILAMVSILSIDYELQADLHQRLEQEFRTVHDDPRTLCDVLTQQEARLRRSIQEVKHGQLEHKKNEEAHIGELRQEEQRLTKKSVRLASELASAEEGRKAFKATLEAHQSKYDDAVAVVQGTKAKRQSVDLALANARSTLSEREEAARVRTASSERTLRASERDHAEVTKRLGEAKRRLALQVTERTSKARPTRAASSGGPPPSSRRTLERLLEATVHPDFVASPVTLDVLRQTIDGDASTSAPASTDVESHRDNEAVAECMRLVVREAAPWSHAHLRDYAVQRAYSWGTQGPEERVEFVLGGLYHAGRVADRSGVQPLLVMLVELINGGGKPPNDRIDLTEALEGLESRGLDGEATAAFGGIQAKLATANPGALMQLYDAMPLGLRFRAKRALVSRVGKSGLQENDPTHELVDVATTHLEALVGPLSNASQMLSSSASLQRDFSSKREGVLAATARLQHVFSRATNRRLVQFRDLFGPHLTEALQSEGLPAYERLGGALLEYCIESCRTPEWISAYYLFPLVLSLARAAFRADKEKRKLKAELVATVDKRQHPLSQPRTKVPLRLHVENSGDATAEEVAFEIEADRREVTFRQREYGVERIAPKEVVSHEAIMEISGPVSAVEVTCLFRWRDVAGDEREAMQTLKLTAQRDVDWARAGANPYKLGSITTLNRLVGRGSDLEALRIGVEGAQSFCITGQKRVGKTSVARVLAEVFRSDERYVTVYLTLGDCVTTSGDALVHSLYGAIIDELN